MGRPRQFDPDAVLLRARDTFALGGYHGTSMDDLLRATGLQRSSLYSAYGSKRGLFLAALLTAPQPQDEHVDQQLLLVAVMDLAGSDDEIRRIVAGRLDETANPVQALGRALLARAALPEPTTTDQEGRP